MFKIGIITSYSESSLTPEVQEQLHTYGVEVRAVRQDANIEWEEYLNWLRQEADAVISCINDEHSNFQIIQQAIKTVPLRLFVGSELVDPELNNISPHAYAVCTKYYRYGGVENFTNLVLYLGKLAGKDFRPSPPIELPWCGYYHPRSSNVYENLEDYLNWYKTHAGGGRRGATSHLRRHKIAGKVGIFFPRSLWIKGDLEHIHSLITELEARGILPIPVFSQKEENRTLGCGGNPTALKLLREVDLIINCHWSHLLPGAISEAPSDQETILKELNVPVIQGVYAGPKTEKQWREPPQGLGPSGQVYYVAQPEFNGVIEPIVICARDESDKSDVWGRRKPIEDRIKYLIDRVCAWLRLYRLPPHRRRVTFLLHNPPCEGAETSVGAASGLDTLESVVRVMRQMKEAGYVIDNIPQNGKSLVEEILKRKAVNEFRWTTVEEIVKKGGVIEFIDIDRYRRWLDELPQRVRERMIAAWGPPPGEAMVYDGKIVVTGLKFGNVNVLVEPKRGCYGARCDGSVCKLLHDPHTPPTHQCLATYKWVQENSDVIISVGTHGYIEFLPGKAVGLSGECFPEIIVGDKPHLYIYTVRNSSEGVLAKRRAYATLVDHMIPVMVPSGLYDKLAELEELLQQYAQAKQLNETTRLKVIEEEIEQVAEQANLLDHELQERFGEDFESLVHHLHQRLTLLRESQINDGLHILSQVADTKGIANMLSSIFRFDGERPSIRRLILEAIGYDYEEAMENPAKMVDGFTYGEWLEKGSRLVVGLFEEALKNGKQQVDQGEIEALVSAKNRAKLSECAEMVNFALNNVLPRLEAVEREIPQLLRGVAKEYIEPGASGLVTRGKLEALPTGRNFYAVDPWSVPTKAGWKVGMRLAEQLLDKYLKEEGKYPENVGMVLWSIDVYRADGEQVSQILYLLGTRPLWSKTGRITGVEVIPLEELNRPRIDVTIRMSGIFRDTLPNLFELIDDAVAKVCALGEPEELNFVKKHVNQTKEKLKAELGSDYEEGKAHRQATYRLFCAAPGAYGNGVSLAVAASAWRAIKDLGEIYIDRGGYAYGKEAYGSSAHKIFTEQLKSVEVSFHKLASDETDLLACCCFYDFQGGMSAAVKTVAGKEIKVYWGDTRTPQRAQVRDMKEEVERIVRTKLLNPRWIEGMKRHGYQGAGEISKRVGHAYGWAVTANVVADWIFNDVVRTFVLNQDNRRFFEENNPWALEEISRRLLEAERRGVWKADPEILRQLEDMYLEIEGWLEEKIDEVGGEFQGGNINVITRREVEKLSGNPDR